MKLTNHGYTIV